MNVVVTGATGFVGRALVLRLLGQRHTVTALVRSPARGRDQLPAGVGITPMDDEGALRAAIAEADAVVNLAGESIARGRWTAARRRALRESRIDVTRRLASAIAARRTPLPVFVSASAIGWYGERGDAVLAEGEPRGDGFLAELCSDWEIAARSGSGTQTRVVTLRFGVVLGLEGGLLGEILPLYRRGLGGPIAGGDQWLSWIHLEDAVAAICFALATPGVVGAANVVAPEPVRQRTFARSLAAAVGRTAHVPVPRWALAALRGHAATIATVSQRVVPTALVGAGFTHRFPTLSSALEDLVTDRGIAIGETSPLAFPAAPYLRARRPRRTLVACTLVGAPLPDVFAFFSSPQNLAALTPPALGFQNTTPATVEMAQHAVIDYRIRLAGVPLRWRTRIEAWDAGVWFVDSQERGPYRAWWHEHHFRAHGGRTLMIDVVHFAAPFGILGRIAERFVEPVLRRIFTYRRHAIRARFAGSEAATLAGQTVGAGRPGDVIGDGRERSGAHDERAGQGWR